MMQNDRRRKKIKQNKLKIKFIYYIPIIFIIVFVPLITRAKIIELNLEEANFWTGVAKDVDFFNYYKSIFFIMGTMVLLASFGGLVLNSKLVLLKEKRYYIPMSTYVLLAIISALMAHNKYVALNGFIGMNQGIFVLLSYIIITYVVMNYTKDERTVKIIICSVAILIIAEGLIGLGQYFGYDLLQSKVGRYLTMPEYMRDVNIEVLFNKYTIYGTMNNTNFVGSFGALVLPLSFVLFLSTDEKKKIYIFSFVSILAFTTWLGCNSRAGYLGIMVSSLIGIVTFRKVIREKYKRILVLIAIFITIVFSFNSISGGKVIGQFIRLNPTIEAKKMENILHQKNIRFEEISNKDNTFKIRTNKETLVIYLHNAQLNFFDDVNNKLLDNVDNDGNITIIDERYKEYSFIIDEKNPSIIKANIYGRKLNLYITEEHQLKVISINKKLTDPVDADRIKLFDERETFASNRGYIWSRTIPMLSDVIFIGYGPDNYPMVFPQEDYVGRFNVGAKGMLKIVVDKPHNMYLQTAVNTGVASLIALIAIWSIYLFDCISIYFKGNISTFSEYMGSATFLSITAYLTAGFFNDSVISVAPLFWILLGMGIGINNMVKCNN